MDCCELLNQVLLQELTSLVVVQKSNVNSSQSSLNTLRNKISGCEIGQRKRPAHLFTSQNKRRTHRLSVASTWDPLGLQHTTAFHFLSRRSTTRTTTTTATTKKKKIQKHVKIGVRWAALSAFKPENEQTFRVQRATKTPRTLVMMSKWKAAKLPWQRAELPPLIEVLSWIGMELSSRSRCNVSHQPPPLAFLFFSLFIFAGQCPCAAVIGTSGFSGRLFFIFIYIYLYFKNEMKSLQASPNDTSHLPVRLSALLGGH